MSLNNNNNNNNLLPSKGRTTRLSMLSPSSGDRTPQSPRKSTSQIPVLNNSVPISVLTSSMAGLQLQQQPQQQPSPVVQLVTVHEDLQQQPTPPSPLIRGQAETVTSTTPNPLVLPPKQQQQQQQQPEETTSTIKDESISDTYTSIKSEQQPQQQHHQPSLPRASTAPLVVTRATTADGNEILTIKSKIMMKHMFRGKMTYETTQNENNMLAEDPRGNLVYITPIECPNQHMEFYMTKEKEDEILTSLKELCGLFHPDVPLYLQHNVNNLMFPFYCRHCKFESQNGFPVNDYLDKASYKAFVNSIVDRINQRIDDTGVPSSTGGKECVTCGCGRLKGTVGGSQ